MGTYKENDIGLVVEWTQHDRFLAGSYTIQNAGAARVLVFDRLYQTDPTGFRTVDPDLVFRWLENDGLYRIAKMVPAIPKGQKFEVPEVPYARILEPGAAIDGRVLVPVPLDQSLPYDVVAGPLDTKQISGIVLTIGFAVMDDELEATAIGTGDDVSYSVWHSWVSQRQKLISTPVFAIALPLKE